MWQARLLLADTTGKWWTDDELNEWAVEARRIINSRFHWHVERLARPCVNGEVSLAGIAGQVIAVGGLKERHTLPPLPVRGTPIFWMRSGTTARLWPVPGDTDVEVRYVPRQPQLPAWAEAGVPLYVAAQAYQRIGPTRSPAKAERWQRAWQRWMAALRDLQSQLPMEVRR